MKIACLLTSGFEDSEFRIPYDRLRAAGHQVDVISLQKGQKLEGERGKEKLKSERGIEEAHPDDYDALLIPGGFSPDKLRADWRVIEFVRGMETANKPIAAVCHGPQLLIAAGLVKGRTLTAWPTIQEDLRQIGANVVDREVAIDRNWITSRKPDDLEAFSRAFLDALGGQPAAHP
jgi:protease I